MKLRLAGPKYLVYSHLFEILTQFVTSQHGFKNDLD